MKIKESNISFGMTFSEGISEFKKNGKKNLFENIITLQTIEEDQNLSQDEKNSLLYILNSDISPFEKRLRIMRALDRGKEFSSKIAIVLRKNIGRMEMISEIMSIFRDHYTKSDILKKDFGEVLTSGEVVKMMISEIDDDFWKTPYDKNGNIKRVLETSNGSGIFLWYVIYKFMIGLSEFISDENDRYKFIIENMIYACEIQKYKMFNWLCIADIHDEYDLNVYCGSFLSVDKKGNYKSNLDGDFDKHMKEVWGINRVSLIISNPPYQKSDGGGTGSSAIPIYNLFIEKSINISDKLIFIIPSRWMAGGKGLNKFRKMMIEGNKITFIKDIKNSDNIFKNTSISGGVCYFEWNNDYNGKCRFNDELELRSLSEFDVLIRDEMSIRILNKVLSTCSSFLDNSVLSRNPYRIIDTYDKINNGILTFTKNGLKYTDKINDRYGIFNKYKVLISKADGAAYSSGRIVSKYKILDPGIASTETYLVCGTFDDKKSAENFGNYLLTKFARFMLSLRLISQNNSSDKFKWVPNLIDYTISYNDEYLFNYFKLDDKEIKFINENIKNLE
jgi:site-specific DNA-methyltransferase (adenine-specific)